MYDNLLKYSEFFSKKAGLLKVDSSSLKEIEEWAVGYYCQRLLKLLYEKRKIYLKRKRQQKILESTFDDKFERLYKIAEGAHDLDDLLDDDEGFYILFDVGFGDYEDVEDPETKFHGIFKGGEIFYFYLSENETLYDLIIHLKSEKVDKYNISKEEVLEIFESLRDEIYHEMNSFEQFYYKFDKVYDWQWNELNQIILECNKYKDEIWQIRQFDIRSAYSNKLYKIYARFFPQNEPDRAGDWEYYKENNEKLGEMNFYFKPVLPSSTEEFIAKINKIKEIARHELQHVVQSIIRAEKGMIKYPESFLTKEIKEEQRKKEKKKKIKEEKSNEQKNYTDEISKNKYIEHAHRNIEFHTRLSDTIDKFKLFIRNFPKASYKTCFKVWIAMIPYIEFLRKLSNFYYDSKTREEKEFYKEFRDSIETKYWNEMHILKNEISMFESFKKNDPEKYKKFVKEFYKEVQDLL